MRVVAGTARGRRLVAPRDAGVRPTSDRVREALFNILGARVRSALVLDLYCGSGAVAVEALSRGAATAVLVDRAATAVAAARENLVRAGVADRATLVKADVEAWLARAADGPYDLVFLDPPYSLSVDSIGTVVARLVGGRLLAPGGLVVVERPSEGEQPPALGPLRVADVRRYGSTRLLFAPAD